MGLWDILVLLVIAAICGGIGQSIAGISKGGCLMSIVVGFIGAWLGRWLVIEGGAPEIYTIRISGTSFPVVWSIIGATVFSMIMGFMSRSFRS